MFFMSKKFLCLWTSKFPPIEKLDISQRVNYVGIMSVLKIHSILFFLADIFFYGHGDVKIFSN